MFLPRTQNLLRKGKGDVRANTLLTNAYPDQKCKVKHYTDILKKLVFDEERSTADMLEAFLRLQENPTLLENATFLILYACGDLNLLVIFFARGIVGKFDLGHQGGQMETKAVIVWLKEVFMYGGLDVQRQVFNKSLKFQPTWIIDFMRWYLFMCNGKQDGVAFHAIMKLQYFPPEIYAYILTAVRHALCDWEDGVEKKRPFTDDNSTYYFGYLA
ncbi:hypothetical protein CYLTODRAFT_460664 [Cylindrobasidium torrendii FP15055 ss-10]|uniref:DUF6532 domain-containing protein n=1 Tax=Cylindrobasidium torrendii FP15055 ss-10 TaxID=1314674 RepID=A0A0D7ARB4_9AGAR|nr:hypothetical protein CYLTODRAFT_460664 [Cylindrobasidium torrendii FP15055 ss-10]